VEIDDVRSTSRYPRLDVPPLFSLGGVELNKWADMCIGRLVCGACDV
jgi:hypothetical protein